MEEEQIYLKIKENINYGSYKKTLFHIHTPASHDYCLYEEKKELKKDDKDSYFKLTDEDLYNIAINENLINGNTPPEIFIPIDTFSSSKEYITYLIMADKLIKNEIEIVVVSDHNTIDGYIKLQEAIRIVYDNKIGLGEKCVYPNLILGVELSCADLNHIVAIFDDKNIDDVKEFINEFVMSKESGTYLSTYQVIDKVKGMDGFFYIAHINSSDFLKESMLSGGYKKKVFSDPSMKIIGVSDIRSIESIKNRLRNYSNKKFGYVLDSDSHSIDTLCKKYFWLKGTKKDFRIIKDLFRDWELVISLDTPVYPSKYIEGIAIKNGPKNFLNSYSYIQGNKDDYLTISFSPSLNCLIGGRGTGKSTVLNLIEFILSQNINKKEDLEMICKHNCVWILIFIEGKEYIIKFLPPIKEYDDDDIMKSFEDIPLGYRTYNTRFIFDKQQIKKYVIRNCIEVYNINYCEEKLTIEKNCDNKWKELFDIFRSAYSINNLVNISNDEEKLNKYIYNLIKQDTTIQERIYFDRAKAKKDFYNTLEKLDVSLNERTKRINEMVNRFNENNSGTIKLCYYNSNTYYKDFLDRIIFFNDFRYVEIKGKKYSIKGESIKAYYEKIILKIGLFKFLKLILEKNIEKILQISDLIEYSEDISLNKIEMDIIQVSKDNEREFLFELNSDIYNFLDVRTFNQVIGEYINSIDNFEIKFNINSNYSKRPQNFRDIKKLSLGQKVVALLSFILAYSDFSEDYTPLVIDQPEDNLDSQYIYYNLVKELRKAKRKRQVIIATHNSTIVTNAKTENVIVMNSNNENGWVEKNGYPTQKEIIKSILMYLEGGIESFEHKLSIYEDFINRN